MEPSAPAPYQLSDDQRRKIDQAKGTRGVGFGAAWLIGGLALSAVTFLHASGASGGVYIVAWGPAVYGGYRIVSGYRLLAKSRN